MDYLQINKLVRKYKRTATINRIERNKLFLELLNIYEPIIVINLAHICISLHEDFKQQVACDLAESIRSFNPHRSSFNTYFYYKLIDIRRRFYKTTNYYIVDNNKKIELWNKTEDDIDDDFKLLDLKLDINKILTAEEQLILKMSYKKQIKNINNKIDNIIDKILNYK